MPVRAAILTADRCSLLTSLLELGEHYILKDLPEGYVLWKHMRTKASSNGKSAPEAARQDTYLYGYPMGKSRYRSAQEFFPHLLWLATDDQGNCLRNCSCRFCYPEAQPAGEPKKVATAAAFLREKAATAQPGQRAFASNSQANTLKQGAPVVQAPQIHASGRVQAPAPTPALAEPFMEPTAEQKYDSDPNNALIYRPGELVWWHRNPAWGLSIVLRRRVSPTGQAQFLLQPLGHPFADNKPVIRTNSPNDMRPWLAWSVPPLSFTSIKDYAFEQVPWERILKGEFGKDAIGSAEVDASILAAKGINQSYSFFDKIDTPLAVPEETFYKGMFLGGEKIWVGEPLRLQGSSNEEIVVMVVKQMIERIPRNAAPENQAKMAKVMIVGDIYTFAKMPTPPQYKNRCNWPTPPGLPARMVQDLHYRNEIAVSAGKNVWREWKLVSSNTPKELGEIKGRWYESKLLLPILRTPQELEQDLRENGEASDAGLHMNSRVHMMVGPARRMKDRPATVGGAVPATTKISRGKDGPPEEDGFETTQG